MIWIVRDYDAGQAMPFVSVWSERPKRWDAGAGRVWLSESIGDPLRGWLGSLWLQDAWHVFGSTPDDDRQVIVMERDPAWAKRKIDSLFKVPKP